MNVKYFLKCIFASENKSLTSVGELWEVKSRNANGDEEYAYLQTLFRMFPLGIPIFQEKSAGEDWLWLEKSLWRVLISAWGKDFRSFSFLLLYWGVILLIERMKVNNLLGIKSMHIFKPCLECFHWGFLFLLFEGKSAGEY